MPGTTVSPGSLPYLFVHGLMNSRCCTCRAAQDLLAHMLRPEPDDRITIAGILSHSWFGTSLENVALNVNKGLLEMPDNMLTGTRRLLAAGRWECNAVPKTESRRAVSAQPDWRVCGLQDLRTSPTRTSRPSSRRHPSAPPSTPPGTATRGRGDTGCPDVVF